MLDRAYGQVPPPARLRTDPRARKVQQGASLEQLGYCAPFSTDWWLISCSLLMVLLSLGAGSFPIVVFLGCAGAVIWRSPGLAGRTLFRYAPLLLIPLAALASAAWSDARDVSVKQGLEFLLFVVCALILLRRISSMDFAGALVGPGFLMCTACLAMQPSVLHGDPLHGFLGSKNIMAFVAQTLTASAITVVLDARAKTYFRLFALVALAIGVLDVVLARSAGAWITSVMFVLVFIVLRYADRVSLGARLAVVAAGVAVLVPCAMVYKQIEALLQTFQTDVLHKNSTLTGRTGLWDFSKSLIAERPVLGHGFAAFWRQGNLDAEALWRSMGIASRSGFNFHNQFIDVTVDFGYAGLTLFIFSLVWIAIISIRRTIYHPSVASAFFTSILAALYSRLPVESVLIGPWNIFTLLWLAAAVHAVSPMVEAAAPTAQSWRRRAFMGRRFARTPVAATLRG